MSGEHKVTTNAGKHTPPSAATMTQTAGANLSVPTFPRLHIGIALIVTALLLLGVAWQVRILYLEYDRTVTEELRLQELRGTILRLDEVLTMSARVAAATGDSSWEKRYRLAEPELDAAIKEAMALVSEAAVVEAVSQTDAANAKHEDMENRAFSLVRQNNREAASALLNSQEYEEQKRICSDGMAMVASALERHAGDAHDARRRTTWLALALIMAAPAIALFVWLSVLRAVRAYGAERRRAEAGFIESEGRYRTLFDTSSDAIMTLTPEKGFLSGNATTIALFGCRDEQEFISLSPADVSPESQPNGRPSVEAAQEMMAIAMRQGTHSFEWTHRRMDGTEFFANVLLTRMALGGQTILQATVREAEQTLRAIHQSQAVTNRLFSIQSQGVTLDAMMDKAIEYIAGSSFLGRRQSGAIFLVEEGTEMLTLTAQRGFAEPLLDACRRVPFGKCLCGRAAASRMLVYADRVDNRHDIQYDGMPPHGHYCVPIQTAEAGVLGVLTVEREEGSPREARNENVLTAAAAALAEIIQRKRAEQEIESLARFPAENPNPVIRVTDDGIITYANPASEELLSRLGSRVGQPLPETWRQMVGETPQEGTTQQHDVEVGDRVYGVDLCSVARRDYVNLYAQDITERKRAEGELRRQAAILEATPDFVGYADAKDAHILYINRGGRMMTGMTPDEDVTKLKISDLHPEWGNRILVETALPTAGRDGVWTGECAFLHRDGHEIPVLMVLLAHKTSSGEVEAFSTISRDITERERLAQQLLQAQKLESIGRLASGIAHEINNPTQYIGDNVRFLQRTFPDLVGLVQKLKRLLTDPDITAAERADLLEAFRKMDADYLTNEVPKAITQALEGNAQIAKIVGALKEFSHPSTRQKKLANLNHAVENAIIMSKHEWKYVADVETHLEPSPPMVPCLPGDINQALLNLIINAAHAIGDVVADEAERKGTITVTTRTDGDRFELRIADTGAGIPEGIWGNIFDPFFTTKSVGRGTGQGLSTARSVVVDKHGGTLTFETETGKGTTFIIRLPVVEPETIGEKP